MSLHPCSPLSPEEILDAVSVIKADTSIYHVTATRIVSIILKEPPKLKVLSSDPSNDATAIDREACAVLLNNAQNSSCEIIINITKKKIVSRVEAPSGSQPMVTGTFSHYSIVVCL